MMDVRHREYVLFCESTGGVPGVAASRDGWRFVLQSADGGDRFEAAADEPDARGERLDLLAVVRGLEALDQPSHVTLITTSRYIRHGLLYGLAEWRENDWRWDRYGEFAPVKNADLWRRIDQTLNFHTLICRTWKTDDAERSCDDRQSALVDAASDRHRRTDVPHEPNQPKWPAVRSRLRRAINACRNRWAIAAAQ
jgi:ribonuclease HI